MAVRLIIAAALQSPNPHQRFGRSKSSYTRPIQGFNMSDIIKVGWREIPASPLLN
jgi:hypothetical protein